MTTTYRSRAELRRVKAWAAIVDANEAHTRDKLLFEPLYFTPETVKYWGNLWHGQPIGKPYTSDVFFVESRIDDPLEGTPVRVFAVKKCSGGVIDTVSEWPHYPTAEAALAAARFVAGVAPTTWEGDK